MSESILILPGRPEIINVRGNSKGFIIEYLQTFSRYTEFVYNEFKGPFR